MRDAYICDAVRTPVGRHSGALAAVRADDLASLPLKALMERNPGLDPEAVEDVIFGCANQAGEDNRNVARMAVLLAGLPQSVPGSTVNRLCGSSLDAVGSAARAVRLGEADLMIAGGVESMSRAPYVVSKSGAPWGRDMQMFDTSIGWRFVNRRMEEEFGTDSMPQTAENLATERQISREDQDAFAARSQQRAVRAQENGRLAQGDHRGDDPAAPRRAAGRGQGRASAPRHDRGEPRETAFAAQGRHGDGRQRFRRE